MTIDAAMTFDPVQAVPTDFETLQNEIAAVVPAAMQLQAPFDLKMDAARIVYEISELRRRVAYLEQHTGAAHDDGSTSKS